MKKLATSLDQEVWAYVPVPSKIANCAKEITARGGIEDTSAEPLAMNGGGEAGELQTLIIAGKEYRTIRTMHVLLELLQQYLAFCDIAPAFTPDVGQRVLGLLRTFNSRTCQLILGAGAMQVSGLKSISAKHLAISCHSVRAAAALFPALEAALVQSVEAAARRKLLADEYARTLQVSGHHLPFLSCATELAVQSRLKTFVFCRIWRYTAMRSATKL